MATETVERAGVVTDADPETSGAAAFELPVPDLQIKGFRGIDHLEIPRFTQVTLIAGRNGIGKTTVLEALEVFATRGRWERLVRILMKRREAAQATNEPGRSFTVLDWESLFFGRSPKEGDTISIGIRGGEDSLRISVATPDDIEKDSVERTFGLIDPEIAILKMSMNGARRYVPMVPEPDPPYLGRRRRRASIETGYPAELQFETVGPDVPGDDQIARMWDVMALSPELREVTVSLTEMYGRQIDGIAMIEDDRRMGPGRRAIVRLAEGSQSVPLKSLGDGAVRIVGNTMSVSRPDTSLVLVDEIENGLHHSIQRQFWKTMIDAAVRNGTQLVATTHSLDCIKGFAAAAVEIEDIDCSLIRISEIEGEHWTTDYDKNDLLIAVEHEIEVR